MPGRTAATHLLLLPFWSRNSFPDRNEVRLGDDVSPPCAARSFDLFEKRGKLENGGEARSNQNHKKRIKSLCKTLLGFDTPCKPEILQTFFRLRRKGERASKSVGFSQFPRGGGRGSRRLEERKKRSPPPSGSVPTPPAQRKAGHSGQQGGRIGGVRESQVEISTGGELGTATLNWGPASTRPPSPFFRSVH